MKFDIFLSHSSEDRQWVAAAKADLAALGYSVFLDSDALPNVRPDQVTASTAQALRDAMKSCTALLYLLSEKSTASRWMPWELGFFDAHNGRVFIYPVDSQAAAHAKGREYLKIYPIVPVSAKSRAAFLLKHVPKSVPPPLLNHADRLAGILQAAPEPRAPELFNQHDLEVSPRHGERLSNASTQAAGNPLIALDIARQLTQAYWRVWGLLPPPERPGADDGKWEPDPNDPGAGR